MAYTIRRTDQQQLSLKFFLSPSPFSFERSVYETPDHPFKPFLPALHSIVPGPDAPQDGDAADAAEDDKGDKEGEKFVDSTGKALELPPCIVAEAGETLDRSSRPDSPAVGIEGLDAATAYQVCATLPLHLSFKTK